MTGTDPIIGPARRLLEHRRRAMVFTGAGISTESGIPDFRSPGGIWSRMQPIDFRDFVRSEEMRREAWRRKLVIDRDFQQAAPNRGHRALAALHARGVLTDIITQNIDGLHQASGVPAEQVIELHGNGTYAACLDCGLRHELAPIVQAFERDETLPLCVACGGIVKSATISFGQAMPQAAMARARAALGWGAVRLPLPKLVVAVGQCACDGGIFGESYACRGRVANVLPVDVTIPGCPPPPIEILKGIRDSRDFSDDSKKALVAALDKFAKTFA